jgi:hypothetical protein
VVSAGRVPAEDELAFLNEGDEVVGEIEQGCTVKAIRWSPEGRGTRLPADSRGRPEHFDGDGGTNLFA